MSEDDVVGVGDYQGAAAGWGALKAVADAVRRQMDIVKETRGLLSMNQPHGFDCPGCACEATAKRTTPEFFAAHTVSELWKWSDFDLENEAASRIRWSTTAQQIDTSRFCGTRR